MPSDLSGGAPPHGGIRFRVAAHLAISGSLRRASTNTAALEALARLAPEGVKVLLYRDLANLPAFNPDDDLEEKPKPEPVETLRALIDASDALVIAAPEYAHGLPGALKNALDWLVASETFAGKPTALINTSPRAFHAQASLREILSTMAARLMPGSVRVDFADGKGGDSGRYSGRHGLHAAAYGIARGAHRRDKNRLGARARARTQSEADMGVLDGKIAIVTGSLPAIAPRRSLRHMRRHEP